MYPVNPDISYGADYYVAKSKGPFLWADPSKVTEAIPWISFLGYSVYHDGSTRLRKETLLAHVKSIREECETFLMNAGKFGFRNSNDKTKAVEDFLCRLMAKGVGRINIEPIKGLGRCWLSVFRFVGESRIGLKQMRYLDYVRSSAVARLLRRLKVKKGARGEESAEESKAFLYFGKPFSYYGSCGRVTRKVIATEKRLSLCEDVQTACDFDISNLESINNVKVAADADRNTATDTLMDIKEPEGNDVYDEEYETSGWERARGFGG